jgi:CRISPR/Cas system-associated exonuclease Cas4 (RecB family)
LDWKSGQEDIKSIYQLVWYAALVRKKLNKEVDTIAPVYLSKEKIVYTPITEALRAVVGDYIGAIYSSILEDTKFLPKKNKYCNYCTLRGGVCNLDQ